MEWAPHKDKFDHLDEEVWRQAIPTLAERDGVTLEAVREASATSEPALFTREMLNVWPALQAVAVIEMTDWEKLEKHDMQLGQDVVMGIDINPNRTHATIAACARNGAFTPLEVIENRQHVGWVVGRAKELHDRWRAPFVIDGGSAAGSLIVELERAGVKVIPIGTRDYARSCGSFYDGVIDGTITHLGDRLLTDAVGAAAKRNLSDQWAWNRHSTVDITPLVAATLARWGVVSAYEPVPNVNIF
jgi:phage terminase large subunit-like protein